MSLNFPQGDHHLDPPDIPDVEFDNDEYLSSCCSADKIVDTDICSHCHDHASFIDGDENEEEL